MSSVNNAILWVRGHANTIRRGLWLLMGVGHLPACLDTWQAVLTDGSRMGACLGLTAAFAFFALKFLDVACLRFRADRRSMIALAVVVAVLHVDVLRPANAPPLLAEGAAVVAATWLLGFAEPIRRMVKTVTATSRTAMMRVIATARTANTFSLDAFHPHCWALILRLHLLRAPPV